MFTTNVAVIRRDSLVFIHEHRFHRRDAEKSLAENNQGTTAHLTLMNVRITVLIRTSLNTLRLCGKFTSLRKDTI